MTTGGSERHNFIIGLEFQQGDAVSRALRTGQDVRDAIQKSLSQPLSFSDILNSPQLLAQAKQAARKMRQEMEDELQVSIKTRLGTSGLPTSTQNAVLAASGGDKTTAGLSEALRKYETQIRLLAAKLARTGDEQDAVRAATLRAEASLVSAYRADENAARAQEKSKADEAKAAVRLMEAELKAAADLARDERRREEASARASVAITRRADQDAAAGLREQTATGRAILAIEKRTAAEDAAAEAAAENARANARSGTFQPEYINPNVATGLGAAQASVNQALRRRQIAEEQHIALMARDDKTVIQVEQSEARLASATTSLTAARRRAEIAEIKAAPVPPARNLAAQFGLGFKGETERPYAEQLGQAFKFSLFYGTAYKLLFALTQTFQQTLQEGIAFQQAVTELKLSAGRADSSMDDLANQLGTQAVQAGQAPSTGVLIGARSLGLYGATQAPAAAQARVAEESARVVSRLALASGQSADELQTNIAAIVNAFGGGADAQFRVADIDAYMAHRFGVAPGATIQAVSEAGTVGAAAGFNQEQVNAIAAALMARTGQTAPAVAGFMAQIFSRGGEGSLTQVAGRYGISATETLSQQIKELAQVYKTASPQDRAELSAAFGRGKVQNAAIALLQSFDEVQKAADEAQGGAAAGAADQAFGERINNIGGQIQLTTATLKEFANQLGQSGVLAVLGVAVEMFRDLVEAGTGLLKLWNDLDPAIKAVLISLGLLAASARIAAASQALQGRLGIIPGAAGGAIGQQGAVIRTATGVAPLASAEGVAAGAAAAGRALLSVTPALLSIAALIAAGQVNNAAGRLDSQQAASAALLAKGVGPTATANDLQARASALDASARDADDAAHGFFAHIVDLGQASARDAKLADESTAEARRLRGVAALQERQDALDAARPKPLITGFDSESLTSSLDAITGAGGTAKERLDAVAASLTASGDAAKAASDAFDASLFAGKGAQSIQQRLTASSLFVGQTGPEGGGAFGSRLAGFRELVSQAPRLGFLAPDQKTTNALPDALRKALSPEEIQKRLQDALGAQGVTSLADINPQVAESLATSVVGDTPEAVLKNLGISDPESITRVREGYVGIIKHWLLVQSKSVHDIVTGHLKLSPAELDSVVDRIGSDTQELLGSLQETDMSGRIGALQRQVRLLRAAINDAPGGATPHTQQLLDAARIALSNQQIDDMENLRRAAQQNARSKAQVAARGRSFLTRELRNAVNAGNQDRLVAIIQTAGRYGIAIAQTAINQAIAAAKAAVAMSKEITSFSNAALADAGIAMRNAAEGSRAELARYRKIRDVIQNTMHGNRSTDTYFTGSDANLPASLTDTPPEDTGPTAAQVAAARQSAYAQGSESQISQARAAMASARADMAAAKKGTVEYYNALGSYLSARNELTDAIQAYRQNLFLLHHDITNPLTQARAETRAAAVKLRSDAGKPGDVRAADRVALRQAEASQEATAFQQRLETVQTAEQLGRTSHAAYIRYLENESRRLNHIKNRTFQQQQQLNQIDGLLQDAAHEMEGQFNIAGIKLPTIYQVRRTIAERAGADGPGRAQIAGTPRGQVNSNNTTYIQIDGADYTKVKRLVTDEINKPGRVVTGAPRRRV